MQRPGGRPGGRVPFCARPQRRTAKRNEKARLRRCPAELAERLASASLKQAAGNLIFYLDHARRLRMLVDAPAIGLRSLCFTVYAIAAPTAGHMVMAFSVKFSKPCTFMSQLSGVKCSRSNAEMPQSLQKKYWAVWVCNWYLVSGDSSAKKPKPACVYFAP